MRCEMRNYNRGCVRHTADTVGKPKLTPLVSMPVSTFLAKIVTVSGPSLALESKSARVFVF